MFKIPSNHEVYLVYGFRDKWTLLADFVDLKEALECYFSNLGEGYQILYVVKQVKLEIHHAE
jgi:hypothetical protein